VMLLFGSLALLFCCMQSSLYADENLPPALRGIGIDQKLNQQAPLDLAFRDEEGRSVALREYFHRGPVVLSLVYYECPMLCTQVLNGLARSLRAISLELGKDYRVISVSINPLESSTLAAAKKRAYVNKHSLRTGEKGWHFLTGDEAAIRALSAAVGFRYAYDAQTRQYVHAAGIMVLTPTGSIARYYYGIDYSPRDLRLGLVEASNGRIGTPVDQLLLFCYHYDPATGKYGPAVMNALRTGGIATLLGLASFIFLSVRKERWAAKNGRSR